MKTIKLFTLLALSLVLINSCQKNTTPISNDEFDLADDEAVAEALFDDVFSSADNAVQLYEGFSKNDLSKGDGIVVLTDSCPIVTVDMSTEIYKVITIDYGEGCEGFNDKVRSGKIIIQISGSRKEMGSSRTVTFDNYYFNGIKMEGVKVTENMGPNDDGRPVFMSSLTGGKLIFPNDTIVEREFTRYREWIAGYTTRFIWDDECLVTGGASGKSYKGVSYQNTITTSLHWKRVCKFFVSGVISIERSGMEAFELDYGDGECDAIATVRRGDEEKQIFLKWRHRKLRNN